MRTYVITLCILITAALASCDKGDIEVRKLNKGEGIWGIESMVIETYDSTGINRISTMEQTGIGEFVFFQNTTLNGLYDEHLVTALLNDASGVILGYTGGVYYDDNRVKIDCSPAPPVFNGYATLNGVWTVHDNGKRKQTWTMYILDNNATLHEKYILEIKKK